MLWYEYPSTADYSYVNPDQAIGGHQEANPDVCVAGPVSTPPSAGTEVFKPCQPLLFSSSNCSCTQVVTFLYGRRSFCSGAAPEGKAEGGLSKQRESLKPAKQIRKWALCTFPLGVVQLVSPLWPSEGLFVLFDSGLDAFAGGRWFIQLWMLAWAACVVVWGCMTTSKWTLIAQRMDARGSTESGSCQCCTELGWTLWY